MWRYCKMENSIGSVVIEISCYRQKNLKNLYYDVDKQIRYKIA